MNYSIELIFFKLKLWTKNKLLFHLNVKKCVYDDIKEANDCFKVIVQEPIICPGND